MLILITLKTYNIENSLNLLINCFYYLYCEKFDILEIIKINKIYDFCIELLASETNDFREDVNFI